MSGNELIKAERIRQVQSEGFDSDRDDKCGVEALASAAFCYQQATAITDPLPAAWPFDTEWWKPRSRQRNLERAGALYSAAAETAERSQDYSTRDRLREHVSTCAILLDSIIEQPGR